MIEWQPVIGRVPVGSFAGVEVRHVRITPGLADELDSMAGTDGWRVFDVGEYASLHVDGRVMMSDVSSERETCVEVVQAARGDVLIAGLGLGMILPPILASPEVSSVTVLEIDPRVLALVAPYYTDPKLRICQANVFDWDPGARRFDVIWFDIWPTKAQENRSEMARLHARYRRYLKRGGTMRSWYQDILRAVGLFNRGFESLLRMMVRSIGPDRAGVLTRELQRTRAFAHKRVQS